MKLRKALEDKQFDVRIRDRLVGDGKISTKDVEGFLTELPEESAEKFKFINERGTVDDGSES